MSDLDPRPEPHAMRTSARRVPSSFRARCRDQGRVSAGITGGEHLPADCLPGFAAAAAAVAGARARTAVPAPGAV